MKRYKIMGSGHKSHHVSMVEDLEGDWVKYEDVHRRRGIDDFRNAFLVGAFIIYLYLILGLVFFARWI